MRLRPLAPQGGTSAAAIYLGSQLLHKRVGPSYFISSSLLLVSMGLLLYRLSDRTAVQLVFR